ncbi:unnamed protein product [Rangifer tarandus platyrhynchus]|uniref:Uncharacterized protein n=1 Tax=Rangifer tarandus platyrhynchus TaxID=3082113 RepID=A0AC59ZH93_RANTA
MRKLECQGLNSRGTRSIGQHERDETGRQANLKKAGWAMPLPKRRALQARLCQGRTISNISVQVVSAPGKLPGRRPRRKPIARAKSKKQLKKKAPFWNVQNKIILFTVFLFILAVIAWTLLWLYISETESRDAFYFAGMFRITNIEFLPEYRQKESREFLSVARTVQQVINLVYTTCAFSKFYRQSVVADVRYGQSLASGLLDKGCSQDFYADHLSLRYPLEISTTSGRLMCHFKLVAIVGHLIRLSVESGQIELTTVSPTP